MNEIPDKINHAFFPKLARFIFLALVASVSIVTPIYYHGSLRLSLSEFVFPAAALFFICGVAFRYFSFRFHKFYLLLFFYLATMLISAVFSINPRASFVKLLGEIYLIGLAVLTFNFVRTEKDFRQAVRAWLFGTFLAAAVGFTTIFLFYTQPGNPLLAHTTHIYGAVPVGNFPRLAALFYSASMFCNFLSVSLILLLIARARGYIGAIWFYVLFAGALVCALFTVSSGIGGIILAVGAFFWLEFREKKPAFAKFAFYGALTAAILLFFVNFFALQSYPNPIYTLKLPLFNIELMPSARILIWRGAFQTFSDNLLTGIGLGQNVCAVEFQNTDGSAAFLTDAHNTFLSAAAQNGIFSLFALFSIVFYFARRFSLASFTITNPRFIEIALQFAFLSAFVYQGLLGSFEDTRHLWILIGFALSAESLEKTES